MQASAQIEGHEALHVKVVAAAGTEDKRYREDCFAEKNNPDDKNHAKCLIRMCPLESYPHYRHIGEAHQPQIPAPPAYSFQPRA